MNPSLTSNWYQDLKRPGWRLAHGPPAEVPRGSGTFHRNFSPLNHINWTNTSRCGVTVAT